MLRYLARRAISNGASLSGQVNTITRQQAVGVGRGRHQAVGGLFTNPLLTSASGFQVFQQNAIVEADRLLREAMSPTRKRKMVQVFDELSNCLCKVADLCEFVRIAHPNRQFAHVAEQASVAISAEVERLNTNRELYNSLLKTWQEGDVVATNETDNYVAKSFLFDFEQSGIHLDEEHRRQVVELNEHILHVGSYFMQGTSKPCVLAKSDVPEQVRRYFQVENDHVYISGLQNDSSSAQVREFAFKHFLRYDDHQEQLLLELIYSRLKLANICGFKSFGQRAINGSIVGSPQVVWQLIDTVNDLIRDNTRQDFDEMLALKLLDCRETGTSVELHQWDVPFYTQEHKVKRFSQDIRNASPYFSLGSCLEGLDLIFNSIFNVKLELCPTDGEILWHPSIFKLAVTDLNHNKTLGFIYCDFFVRNGKPFHDCHFTIQGGCNLPNGEYQLPIVVIFLNFPNPSSSRPTLLTPAMVDNLFHEMGHGMHSMLARSAYQHITGTRCSTDLAEVPSILMENFASDVRIVRRFARHYESGKVIDEKLLRSWIDSKNVFAASDLQLQVFYSALDQVYHGEKPLLNCSTSTEVLTRIQDKYYGLPNSSNISWQQRFGHLVGYGAKYYSYLVSKAVANSIWQRLFERDPLSASSGQRYVDEVLAHGGGKPPREIVQSVLGQKIDAKFLAKSLADNVDMHYRR